MNAFEDIRDNFEFLSDWEDRYRYVIELGKTLAPLPEDDHNAGTKVEGCASQVWLKPSLETSDGQTVMVFLGDSDAHIVRGLVAIVIALYSERTPEAVLAVDAASELAALGLDAHLSPQRSNGLKAMVERIRHEASKARADAA